MSDMPDGRVTHAAHEGRQVLRYFGRVNYTVAPAIERFIEGMLDEIRPGGLVFDLRAAKMLDSTNLGLMARLAERIGDDNGDRCVVVSTNDDITDVVRSMGLQEVFEIVTEHPAATAAGPETEIAAEPPSRGELLRTMLEAHRVLAALDDTDGSGFKAVVECLESEMNAHH